MRNLLYIISAIIFSNCSDDKNINFNIANDSGVDIDSIVLTGLGKAKIKSLKNSQTISTQINYSQSKTHTDGNYQIKIFEKGISRDYHFGYYTNGLPISDYNITIESDTITIKEQLHHK